ncbi:MAG: helix-turn-helix transcriptional regulator [Gemmatimonadales bacterium]|nr:helix-turn-helix transcriptional regulator [Candidatus Palauibacter denitrificans]
MATHDADDRVTRATHTQMTSRGDPYDRIVALLNEATFDEARWAEVHRMIGDINRMRGSALTLYDAKGADPTVFLNEIYLFGQRRKDWEYRYFTDYWAGDERVPRIAQLEHGRPVPIGDLYTDAEKRTSRSWNEALVDTNAQNGLSMRLDGSNGLGAVWELCDSTERGGWSSDQIRLIRRLQPHIHQSAILRHALIEAGAAGMSATGLLASPRVGIIHLDRRGRIMTANDRALQTLRKGDGLMDWDGFLHARTPEEDAEMTRLLSLALRPWGVQGSAGSMAITQSSSRPERLALHISPVGDDYPHFRTRRLGAVVLLLDPTSRARIDAVHVAKALDLTRTESELAVALANGRTVKDLAQMIGRTEATVRWHLKQLYRKQGISRQVDLVRRVLSLESFGTTPRDP